jgi:hypothetical protein
MSDEANERFQFALTKYEADRAHELELELEKVSAQIEIAFIQAVVVLNGVAATAFLSFLSNKQSIADCVKLLSLSSLGIWALGLLFGLIAGMLAYVAQNNFSRVLRNERHAFGIKLLGRVDKVVLGIDHHETIESMLGRKGKREGRGNCQWQVFMVLAFLSMLCLTGGVGLAAFLIGVGYAGSGVFEPNPLQHGRAAVWEPGLARVSLRPL